jgi:hypothetical protein
MATTLEVVLPRVPSRDPCVGFSIAAAARGAAEEEAAWRSPGTAAADISSTLPAGTAAPPAEGSGRGVAAAGTPEGYRPPALPAGATAGRSTWLKGEGSAPGVAVADGPAAVDGAAAAGAGGSASRRPPGSTPLAACSRGGDGRQQWHVHQQQQIDQACAGRFHSTASLIKHLTGPAGQQLRIGMN